MIFCGMYENEIIDLHPDDNLDELWSIDIMVDKHYPVFYVSSYDGTYEWIWGFKYASKTVYEKVKWCIINTAYEVENIRELMYALDEIFIDCFHELLIQYDDTESEYDNKKHSTLLN